MYLTKIDPHTGFIDIDNISDGVLSIKEFRDLINDKDFGLACFTAVALTADYRSPLRFYNDTDRPRASMEEVTGNRDMWPWANDKIQLALKKYDQLQYDPVIEEGKIHYERKVNKLREYREAEMKYGVRGRDKELAYPDIKNPAVIAKELRAINNDIAEYEKQIQGADIFKNSPSKSGYNLSRLEQKLLKKVSFYTEKR